MIPGGREGIRFLHQLVGTRENSFIDTDDREATFVKFRAKHPHAGVLNPGVAAAWDDPVYAEAVICGRENRLSADQVRRIRYLAAVGHSLESIKTALGAVNDGQIKRVLAGRAYSRIK